MRYRYGGFSDVACLAIVRHEWPHVRNYNGVATVQVVVSLFALVNSRRVALAISACAAHAIPTLRSVRYSIKPY